jgi:rfaE bifunctional protein nucleotidyltransferase chain/domain
LNPRILTLEQALLRFGRAANAQLPTQVNHTRSADSFAARPLGSRVVFTNGCFDLLHPGHVRTLEAARQLGDVLIVGINSDNSVRQLKGNGRPVLPELERAEILASFESVDAVVIFDQLTPREIISAILPDVLVKGGDWADDQIIGREEVEAAGGRVVSIPVAPGHSTTAILQRIRAGAAADGTAAGTANQGIAVPSNARTEP